MKLFMVAASVVAMSACAKNYRVTFPDKSEGSAQMFACIILEGREMQCVDMRAVIEHMPLPNTGSSIIQL